MDSWIICPENHGKWWENHGKMGGIYDGKSTGSLILMSIDFQKKIGKIRRLGQKLTKKSDLSGYWGNYLVAGWAYLKNHGVKVSWDDEIPNWMESPKIPWFQTTNQLHLWSYVYKSSWDLVKYVELFFFQIESKWWKPWKPFAKAFRWKPCWYRHISSVRQQFT